MFSFLYFVCLPLTELYTECLQRESDPNMRFLALCFNFNALIFIWFFFYLSFKWGIISSDQSKKKAYEFVGAVKKKHRKWIWGVFVCAFDWCECVRLCCESECQGIRLAFWFGEGNDWQKDRKDLITLIGRNISLKCFSFKNNVSP